MHAASSPMTCTCGFRMVVWMGLLFLASTAGRGRGGGLQGAPRNLGRARGGGGAGRSPEGQRSPALQWLSWGGVHGLPPPPGAHGPPPGQAVWRSGIPVLLLGRKWPVSSPGKALGRRAGQATWRSGSPVLLSGAGPSLTVLEVESVEVHPFDQIAQSFRLERGQAWVTDFPGGADPGEERPLPRPIPPFTAEKPPQPTPELSGPSPDARLTHRPRSPRC